MNNKKITYLLIVVVAIVWGIIFYRLFAGAGSGNDIPVYSVTVETDTEVDVKKDTVKLIANYKDPFLGRTYTKRVIAKPKKEEKKTVSRRRTSRIKRIKWPNIKYGGIIKSQKKDNQVALMNVNNKNKLMYENDIFKEVKLLKIFKDSIHVTYKEETKTILKAK